jgi:hypothetical protein
VNFDPETGEVLEGLDHDDGRVVHLPTAARVRELEAQVGGLKESLEIELVEKRKLRSQLSGLKDERNRQRDNSPHADDARRVFEYWQERLSPDAREFGAQRFDAVVARLKGGYTVEALCRAIDGYRDGMPADITGSQREQMQELEYICRHPKHVDRGIAWAKGSASSGAVPGTLFADAAQNEPQVPPAPPAVHRVSPLDRAVMALRDEFGHDRVWVDWDDEHERPGGWWSVCPIRPGEGVSPMKLVEVKGVGSSVFFACAHGCSHGDLADAVRAVELRHDRRHDEAVSRARAAA